MKRKLASVMLLVRVGCSAKQLALELNQLNQNANQTAQAVADKPVTDSAQLNLSSFDFETVTVNAKGAIVSRRKGQTRFYVEDITGVALEMVGIPSDSFQMGSAEFYFEGPVHLVNVPAFYLGKCEVTQAKNSR